MPFKPYLSSAGLKFHMKNRAVKTASETLIRGEVPHGFNQIFAFKRPVI